MKKIFGFVFTCLLAFGFAAGAVGQVSAADGDPVCIQKDPDPDVCFTTIGAAIAAASPGDTITIADGYYPEVLQIYKQITLKGSGTGTIINASASLSYGMDVYGDGVTLQDFVFIGPSFDALEYDRYGIKVAGDPAKAPTKGQNFLIQNVVIQNSGRTGLDLHGLDGVSIRNVISRNNYGAGIALTDVDNAELININTSGNTWGQGVVINTTGAYYDGGSDGITITNLTSAETYPVIVVMAGGYLATNLEVPQYPFMVMNNTDAPGVIVFRPTLSAAQVDALAAPTKADSVIKNLSEDTVYVAPGMSIQTAINSASARDTINVAAGNYPERIVINKPLSLVGAGVGLSVIDGTAFGGPPFGFIVDITTLTGNTKIEGFDIKTGDWNTGIHSSGGTDAAGKIEILNNNIISTNFDSGLPPSQQMQYGIIAGYMDVRKLVISGNEISDTYDNSILVELQMGATEITNNVFNGAYPSVFFMTYDGHDVTPLQKVSNNTFDMSLAETDSGAAAIGVNPSTLLC